MTCDSNSRPQGRDVKQARGEARQSGGATSAASPNLYRGKEDTVEELAGLLRVLEWGDEDNPGCPFCGMGKETGHLERCQLDAALSKVSPLG
jgi:hypothetical protein